VRIGLFVAALALSGLAAGASGSWFIDDFSAPSLDPSWTADASPGDEVRVVDGELVLHARVNTYAHIERRLGEDGVAVAAHVRPGVAAASWSCGVFLYWDTNVWCQLSIVDHGGGVYYTVERTGEGAAVETQLAPADREQFHWLRIELGDDCVRYATQADGEDGFTVRRVMERPTAFAGPPQLLIVGKGFGGPGTGVQTSFPHPDLDNDYPDPGPECAPIVDCVTIRPTPAPRRRLMPGGVPPHGDAIGEGILERPGDPTYDEVAAVYPPLRHGREAIGPKGHPDEIGVDEFGALELDGGRGRLLVGPDAVPFGENPRAHKALLDGFLPIVVAQWDGPGIGLEETVIGYSEGLSPDVPLQAMVRVEAHGGGTIPLAFEAHSTRLVGQASAGSPWCLRVPFRASGGGPVAVDERDFAAALGETRRFWLAELAKGMQVHVPDQRLMNAYQAWLAYNAIDVDKVDGYYEPHDGAHFYEEVYGYSAARYAFVLDLYGRHGDAEAYLATLMNAQTPDGLLSWNFGLTDTGMLLVALAQHYRLTGDVEWLRTVARKAVLACEWLRRARAEARGKPTADPSVTYGLIRFRSYCDYPTPVVGYLHNAYCAEGMRQIGAVLAEIGLADASWIKREAARYRRDVLRSMRQATIEVNGRPVIPLEPDTQRLLRDSNYRSTNYYTLVASMMLECGLPEPRSVEGRTYTEFLRREGGIQLGVCEFAGGIDHAYTYGYMLHRLLNGEPERFILGVYASLAYGMSRETYSSVEVTMLKTGENYMTLPHLYSGTQQLLMLRTMLVLEDGEDLILCLATPRQWLQDGKRVEVRDACTLFGPMSFSIESHVSKGEIEAHVTPPTRRPPHAVKLRLRHSDGRRIRSVSVDGRPWAQHDDETVWLPVGVGGIQVVASYGQ